MSTFQFPDVTPNASSVEKISNTLRHVSTFTGATQTVNRGGERTGMTMTFVNLKDAEARRLLSFIAKLNGMEHRFMCRDHSYTGPSGTLSTITELAQALNTTNYTRGSSWLVQTDLDEGIRLKRTGNNTNGTSNGASVTCVVGQSYAQRNAVLANTELVGGGFGVYIVDSGYTTAIVSGPGSTNAQYTTQVYTGAVTAPTTTLNNGISDNTTNNQSYGQWDWTHTSFARCLLVDNGYNGLTFSEQIDNAAWTKTNLTITANAEVSPEGESPGIADEVADTATLGTHTFSQDVTRTSTAEFWTASVFVKNNNKDTISIRLTDGGSSNYGVALFNVNTGVEVGSASALGTAGYAYSSIDDWGNGWYRCRISCRLPATTTATMEVYLTEGGEVYSGTGDSIYVWGAQLQQGGQIGRYVETTTTGTSGTDQTGNEIWLKGLNHNEDGQLLAGDQIAIDDRLYVLETDLDGDDSGVGLAVVTPSVMTAPADEAPAHIYQPHGKFMLADKNVSRGNAPGSFTDITLRAIEDIT